MNPLAPDSDREESLSVVKFADNLAPPPSTCLNVTHPAHQGQDLVQQWKLPSSTHHHVLPWWELIRDFRVIAKETDGQFHGYLVTL